MSYNNFYFKPGKLWVILMVFVCTICTQEAAGSVLSFKKTSDGVLFNS
jgi:hypothetical protein